MATGDNLSLKILKIFGITIASLLGLVLLVLVALQFCIRSSVLDKIVLKVSSSYVDGNLAIGDVDFRIAKSFPDACLTIDSLTLTYPHERFDSLAAVSDEGRGELCDTLLDIRHLYLQADVREFVRNHGIHVRKLVLDGPRAFAYRYDTLNANWDIIKLPAKTEKDTSGTSFTIPFYSVDECVVSTPRAVFQDLPGRFAVTAGFSELEASAAFVPGDDSSKVKLDMKADDIIAQDLISTVGTTFVRQLAAVRTDALVDLAIASDGYVKFNPSFALPPVQVSLDVPDAEISYSGYFRNGRFSLTANGENTADGVLNVDVPQFGFSLDGLDLDGTGSVEDVLGRDRRYAADASARAALEKVVKYLPPSLRGIVASGNVGLDINGSILQSQLSASGFSSADVSGHLTGDVLKLEDAADGLSCYLSYPDLNVGTMDFVADSADRSLALSGKVDSVGFGLGQTLCAQGRNIRIFGQNASKLISAESKWHSLAGKVTADMLRVRYDDSLNVVIGGSSNKFTVTGQGKGDEKLPFLRFETDNERLLMRSGSIRAAAHGAYAVASAQMRRRRKPGVSRSETDTVQRRYFSRELLDSAKMPDFLQEKDFRLSDIDIKLDSSITGLLKTWTPSGQVRVDDGMFVMSSYPLRNRISGLSGTFKDDLFVVDSATVNSGTSDIKLSLEARGLKRALTSGRTIIGIDANLYSKRLNVNEILTALRSGKDSLPSDSGMLTDADLLADADFADVADSLVVDPETSGHSLIVVPANVNATLDISAERVDYSNLVFSNVHSGISMKERCLQLTDTKAESDMGRCSLDAFYSTKSKKDINAGFNLALADVTADKVIDMFPKIDEVVPMLKSFKGNLDCEMAATTQLDTNMNFLLPSISGMFKIGGRDLVLEDIGSLKKITKALMFKDKTTGHIDDMTVNGVIKDNSLEVFPFVLSVDRYTVALNGVQSLGSAFDYHVSVIKSPLPFKIGVNIYGPDFSHWSYRLGKAKYRSTKIPLFNEAVDDMQINLVNSIRNIFSRGVDMALKESRQAQEMIARKKQELDYQTGSDEMLSKSEQYELEKYMIGQELDDATDELNDEIDRLFEEMSVF